MRFHDPWILLLILPVSFCLFLYLKRERSEPGIQFPDRSLLGELPGTLKAKAARHLPFLRALSLLVLLLALARPQLVEREAQVDSLGIDIMLVVDVSTSMLARDLDAGGSGNNRLALAQEVIQGFVRERRNDRIGAVVFAARPYLLAPLTRDHDWLLENLNRTEAGMVEDGTAIGEGVMAALNRMRGYAGNGKVIILLTDGRNNAGEITPLVAAEAARALGIRIYTIGVGSRGKAVYPVMDPFGRMVYRSVAAEIDDETLRSIAATTGAGYYRAADVDGLRKVYKQIDLLEKGPAKETVFFHYRELYAWFLLPGLLLLLFEGLLGNTLLKRIP